MQQKEVIGKGWDGFTESKSYLTELISSYDKITLFEGERRVMDAIYLNFSKLTLSSSKFFYSGWHFMI